MPTIHIRDLSDSTELDQKAMRTIVGGARTSQPWQAITDTFKDRRIVDYPPGFKPRSAPGISRK